MKYFTFISTSAAYPTRYHHILITRAYNTTRIECYGISDGVVQTCQHDVTFPGTSKVPRIPNIDYKSTAEVLSSAFHVARVIRRERFDSSRVFCFWGPDATN
jgi:hypothetical protein